MFTCGHWFRRADVTATLSLQLQQRLESLPATALATALQRLDRTASAASAATERHRATTTAATTAGAGSEGGDCGCTRRDILFGWYVRSGSRAAPGLCVQSHCGDGAAARAGGARHGAVAAAVVVALLLVSVCVYCLPVAKEKRNNSLPLDDHTPKGKWTSMYHHCATFSLSAFSLCGI